MHSSCRNFLLFHTGDLFFKCRKTTLNYRYSGQTGRYTGLTDRFTVENRTAENTGIPAKPAGIPDYPTGLPLRTGLTAEFEFKNPFDRFRPVSDLTGPVNRYRSPAVRPVRSGMETLLPGCRRLPTLEAQSPLLPPSHTAPRWRSGQAGCWCC